MAPQNHINGVSVAIAALILLVTCCHYVDADYAQQFMGPQNAVRARLRLKPLKWDAKLARYAQWWANQRRHDCALMHSNGPYGENLFWGSGDRWKPAQAANGWLSEARSYNYRSNSCNGEMCGHYTQIVWKNTQRIGCAHVICSGGAGVFLTCNYDPPGNFLGTKPY
ncbi:Pathogenesis-related protein PR-1 [Cardamine amara subsp. amara]|uniref:Pathogenesis-related protein 1 n=1 Tax=Cardamine amara subsp. amara TaxID=228776 RepID=A0ABD1AUY2_CARAN